ncbi:MAG: molybdopterin synthase sulfur carrier subunit [Halothiobacillaceae bacterium]|nr:MAG: molybdopterin synthase sulfur carrier subunit [Halothiobacillaceae bacterium]
MTITVKYFASMRDKMGRGEDVVAVDGMTSMTVEDVWKKVNNGAGLPQNTLIAVNMEYTDGQHAVKDGDELAFFPPVTGG